MNYEFMNNNVVTLCGTITEEPRYSHQMYGEGFYESVLSVPRLSGQLDHIPFTISERLLGGIDRSADAVVSFSGQLRSYNKIVDGKSKLLLTMFVREVIDNEEGRNPNSIDIVGYVCKEPVYRMTPFKREICDVLIAVNRAYNKSDYLPCIAWGRNARFMRSITVGTKVTANGRIQSRTYQKALPDGTTEERVAYEVSINRIEPADGENDEM